MASTKGIPASTSESMRNFDKNELFFTNPTSKTIKFSIENNTFKLKPNHSLLIETHNNIIHIKSNCLFFRPTIFSYKDLKKVNRFSTAFGKLL